MLSANQAEAQFDFMKPNQWSLDISDDEVWADDDYFSCCWCGVRVKKLELRRNMLSAKQALHEGGMAGVQYHNQHVQEWDPWKTSLGEWVMPGQAEKEHPARFVWQMAVAISCETAKKLQFRLRVPHSPALQPLVEDNRSWWINYHPTQSQDSRWYQLGYIFHGVIQLGHLQHIITWHPPSWSSHST